MVNHLQVDRYHDRLMIQEMQLIYVPMYRIRPKKDIGQVLHKGTASVCG